MDVATYGCNMMAERIKERDGVNSRKARVMIEVIIPGFAIMSLFGVTTYFTWVAVGVLQSHADGEDNVNVVYLYAFSSVNFVIDVLCIGMFYFRGKDVFLERRPALLPQLSLDTSIHSNDSDEFGSLDGDDFHEGSPLPAHAKGASVDQDRRNLNMLSAFAHMGGDSLRTVSVLTAALVSTLSGASVDLCDAWAAIVVSAIIVLFMLPLVTDIARACCRLARENQDYERLDDRDLDEIVV